MLEEVTVTAQRRTERSLDVPISITALGADQVGRGDVQQLGDTMKLTPGIRFDTTGRNAQPTILGVGSAVVATDWDEVSNSYKPSFTLESDSAQLKIVADLGFAEPTSYTQVRNEVGTHNYDSSDAGVILRLAYPGQLVCLGLSFTGSFSPPVPNLPLVVDTKRMIVHSFFI